MALPVQLGMLRHDLGGKVQCQAWISASMSLFPWWVSRYSEPVQDPCHRAIVWSELEEEKFVYLYILYDIFFCLPSMLATPRDS